MKELIKFIEETTGEKFDKDAFFKVMKQHNKEVRNEFEVWEYAKTKYTAFGHVISPLFHAFYFTFSGGSMPYIDKTAKKALRIAEKAYKNKIVSFDKARHRMITWGGPAATTLTLTHGHTIAGAFSSPRRWICSPEMLS